ncbi:multidrug effflux MFS transporter [Desulfospira joergensenii]|uniref:multidrug effflux MFS transporter n=1 Tax=Desulfospira joergensenii TaxID=53329 RepID=UPI0003B75C37|nr:multidrug effflux MFS transporter [Desulfospira joergensenii]
METSVQVTKTGPGYKEFIALMAVMISITALSIDMMLPALPQMGRDLHVARPNDVQLVVSLLIFGMGLGQIFFGPLSDSFGRKPVIFTGFVIFALGCLLSIFSSRFEIMLAGRLIQGLGAAGPRTAIIALIRDQYHGRAMARIMSAVMAVFIFIPAMAPSLGQAILLRGNWRAIFGVLMIQGIVALTWFTIRQPETLPRQHRIPFSAVRILKGLKEVCSNRLSLGYTLASAFMLGVLLTYLNCAQQIYQEVFGLGREFPLYMAFLALCIGGASLVNSRIVMKFGMRALSYRAVLVFILLMIFYLAAVLKMGEPSSPWLFMVCFSLSFFCLGILFGNQNSIAMEPLGHIAGIGAAVIGSLTSLISSPLSMIIGRAYNGSTLPLAWGFVILGLLTAAAMAWADHSRVKTGPSN